jgi:hypothetical protein
MVLSLAEQFLAEFPEKAFAAGAKRPYIKRH